MHVLSAFSKNVFFINQMYKMFIKKEAHGMEA